MAIPRPHQRRLVGSAYKKLNKEGNTLAIAATGAGKTYCMAFLGAKFKGRKLVLQHTQELVNQNSTKYQIVNPKESLGFMTSTRKRWAGVTFAMVQTLVNNLESIPNDITVLMIDEAHHVPAPTWTKIVEAVKAKNPKVKIVGFTATPERADGASLRCVFSNVCDQISVKELVALGYLVPPKALVIDAGDSTHDELRNTKSKSDYGDQTEIARILDSKDVNAEVVRQWNDKAFGRQTIAFCATVEHASHVADVFNEKGIPAACIHGGMKKATRAKLISDFDAGVYKVVTNVFTLTEGFDSQPVSCVIMLRQCSEKAPMIQMIGRGLRVVDAKEYPGIIKRDCIVMDFGTSILTHGDLNQNGDLPPERVSRSGESGDVPVKKCPENFNSESVYMFPDPDGNKGCGAELPVQTRTCPFCGFQFRRIVADTTVTEVDFTEIDILNASPFQYTDLFNDGLSMLASGFNAWVGVFSADGETWHAVGGRNEEKGVEVMASTSRIQAISTADDFLRTFETDSNSKKSAKWIKEPATAKQVDLLRRFGYDPSAFQFTKYSAACHAKFQFNKRAVRSQLLDRH